MSPSRWWLLIPALVAAAPAQQRLPVPAPKDAVVLFDGKGLDSWVADAHWKIVGGAIEVDSTVPHPSAASPQRNPSATCCCTSNTGCR